MPKFPSDLGHRAAVLTTDKLLIHNITTGATEYSTVSELLAALAIYGNVGIGTVAPQEKLHVYKAIGSARVEVETGDGNAAAFKLTNTAGSYSAYTQSNSFRIYDNIAPAERLIIDSAGNVGIGTVTPTSKLQVVGIPVYANNAAAIVGGLTAGAFYRTGGDPDPVCIVH